MSRIESLRIAGPAGPLEAILKHGPAPEVPFAAVVCHPHPLEGGTMHNKVVFHISRALWELGATVLRFNFRGVGTSAGTFDEGRGERDDARAALDHLARAVPGRPLCLAGFSFGSWVGAPVGCADERVTQIVAVGTPTRLFGSEELLDCVKRKLFVQGDGDAFGPVAELQALVARLPGPTALEVVAGADHFFTGRLDALRAAITGYFAAAGSPAGITQTRRARGPSNSHK